MPPWRPSPSASLSSTGEVGSPRAYFYFPLSAKRTSVPVLLYEALPKRRTAANVAGFGVHCLLSPGWLFPRTNPEDDTSPIHPLVEQTDNSNPWPRLWGHDHYFRADPIT
jgi:hypothetical protein